jgi:excisionase family DNA binding protein
MRRKKEIILLPTEVGRLLNPPVSGQRVRQMIDEGVLRCHRTPGGWRLVPLAEVEKLIAKRAQEAG